MLLLLAQSKAFCQNQGALQSFLSKLAIIEVDSEIEKKCNFRTITSKAFLIFFRQITALFSEKLFHFHDFLFHLFILYFFCGFLNNVRAESGHTILSP